MKWKKTIITATVLIMLLVGYIKGCAYLPIEGTVIDAETKQPIEGAVVLAEWTLTKGIGFSYTKSYKVIQAVTDRDGRFIINGYVFLPIINKPILTIYKKGYVCWNNEYFFPDYRHREDFKWESNSKYELERFKKEYSYNQHLNFVEDRINSFLEMDKKRIFRNAYQWESTMRQRELRGEK